MANYVDNLLVYNDGVAQKINSADSVGITGDVSIGGNLLVTGDIVSAGTANTLIGDNFLDLSAGNTNNVTPKASGFTFNIKAATGFSALTATEFIAGVVATTAPQVVCSSAVTTLVSGDIIQVSGAKLAGNNGLFIVESAVGTTITIYGVGGTSIPAYALFSQSQFTSSNGNTATIVKIDMAALAIADGTSIKDDTGTPFSIGQLVRAYYPNAKLSDFNGTTVGTGWTSIGSGATGVTLQSAYEGGNSIQMSSAEGDLSVGVLSGSAAVNILPNKASQFVVNSADLTLGTQTSGAVDIDSVGVLSLNSSGAAINIGNDPAAQPINVGTGASARTITVGNTTPSSVVDLKAQDMEVLMGPGAPGYQSLYISNEYKTLAGDISLWVADGNLSSNKSEFYMDSTGYTYFQNYVNGHFTDIDSAAFSGTVNLGTGAAEKTVNLGTSNAASLTAILAGTGGLFLDATGVVEINSSLAAISIGNDPVSQNINIGNGAAARTLTIGNATGATQIDVNSGTGGITLDTTSGGVISLDAIGARSNFTVTNEKLDLISTGALAGGTQVLVSADNTAGDSQVVVQAGTYAFVQAGTAPNYPYYFLADGDSGFSAIEAEDNAGAIYVGGTAHNSSVNIGTSGARVITIGTSGAASTLDVNVGSGGITIDAVGSGVSIDAASASNFTVTGGTLTLSTATSGDLNLTSAAGMTLTAATGISLASPTTVQSGNYFALGSSTTPPTGVIGALYFDSDLNGGEPVFHNGTSWQSFGTITASTTLQAAYNASTPATITLASSKNLTVAAPVLGTAGIALGANAASNFTVNNATLSIGGTGGSAQVAVSSTVVQITGSSSATLNSTTTIGVGDAADDSAINIGTAFNATGRAIALGNLGGTTGVTVNAGSAGLTVDSVGAIEINSSTSTISVGNDAINQNINFGTGGVRTLSIGSSNATVGIAAGTGRITLTGGDDAVDVVMADTSGNKSNMVFFTSGGFGKPSLALVDGARVGGTFVGGVVGSKVVEFGLVDGLSLYAPSGKDVGFRMGLTQAAKMTSAGVFQSNQAGGAVAIKFATDTARLHLGTGTNDYLISNGTNVKTPGAFAVGSFASTPSDTRPGASTVGAGGFIYDTALSQPVWSDGATWQTFGSLASASTLQNVYNASSPATITLTNSKNLSVLSPVSGSAAISLNANSPSNFSLTGADLTLATLSSGGLILNSAEGVDVTPADYFTVSAGGLISINSNGGDIQIGNNADSYQIDVGTDGVRNITIGNANPGTGVFINGGTGSVSIDAALGGGIYLTAKNDSYFKVTGNDLALATLTSGDIDINSVGILNIDSAGALSINSSAGLINVGNDPNSENINVGTGAAVRTITVGNTTGTTKLDFRAGTLGIVATTDFLTVSGYVRPGVFATGSLPVSAVAGAIAHDTDVNQPVWYDGTAWRSYADSGQTFQLSAAASSGIVQGQILYIAANTGNVGLADCDTVTANEPAAVAYENAPSGGGLFRVKGAVGLPVYMKFKTGEAPASSADIGKVVYLSNTAGSASLVAPTVIGERVYRLGIVKSSTAVGGLYEVVYLPAFVVDL